MKLTAHQTVKSAVMLVAVAQTALWAAPPAGQRAFVDAKRGYLLGGSNNGAWVEASKMRTWLKGGDSYRVLSPSGAVTTAPGGKPASEGPPCEDTYYVRFPDKTPPGIAMSGQGNGNARPRKARAEKVNAAFYRNEVASFLKTKGIKSPQVSITKLWRVDLDGDGTDEVLINATRHNGKPGSPVQLGADAKAGDYSILLLRHVTAKGVRTVLVDGNYNVKDAKFSAPNEVTLSDVLDLNGDGRLEIVAHSHYYEGDSVAIYEFKNGQTKAVLGAGCGA